MKYKLNDHMQFKNESIKIYELLRKKELGQVDFVDEMTLPKVNNLNKILEKLLLGIPTTLTGIQTYNGKKHILNTDFNFILLFLNGDINFKSDLYTNGEALNVNHILESSLNRIMDAEVNIYTLGKSVDNDYIVSFFDNEYTLEQIQEIHKNNQ